MVFWGRSDSLCHLANVGEYVYIILPDILAGVIMSSRMPSPVGSACSCIACPMDPHEFYTASIIIFWLVNKVFGEGTAAAVTCWPQFMPERMML